LRRAVLKIHRVIEKSWNMAPKVNPNAITIDSGTAYIAVQNSSIPIPSFEERGIKHLMPGKVSDVPVFVENVCYSLKVL